MLPTVIPLTATWLRRISLVTRPSSRRRPINLLLLLLLRTTIRILAITSRCKLPSLRRLFPITASLPLPATVTCGRPVTGATQMRDITGYPERGSLPPTWVHSGRRPGGASIAAPIIGTRATGAPHIGYYGGIDYGFGYTGRGYYGAYWNNGTVYYNRAVTNVNVSIVHNVYNYNVRNSNVTRVSYNGGRGGIEARPTPQELAVVHETRIPPVAAQFQHAREASANRAQFAAPGGRAQPAALVASRPIATPYQAPAARPPASSILPPAHSTPLRLAPQQNGTANERPVPQTARVPENRPVPQQAPQQSQRPAAVEQPQARPEPSRPAPQARPEPSRPAPQARPEPSRPAPQARPEPSRPRHRLVPSPPATPPPRHRLVRSHRARRHRLVPRSPARQLLHAPRHRLVPRNPVRQLRPARRQNQRKKNTRNIRAVEITGQQPSRIGLPRPFLLETGVCSDARSSSDVRGIFRLSGPKFASDSDLDRRRIFQSFSAHRRSRPVAHAVCAAASHVL